jgi:hypothetical protein
MTVPQSYVFSWLAGRLEWERTLAALHARVEVAPEAAAIAPVAERPVPVETAVGELPRRKRARMLLWSPIRGMSRRSSVLRIRT